MVSKILWLEQGISLLSNSFAEQSMTDKEIFDRLKALGIDDETAIKVFKIVLDVCNKIANAEYERGFDDGYSCAIGKISS